MRVFTAGLGAESNSFSPSRIGFDAFESCMLYRPGTHPPALTEVSAPLYLLRRQAPQRGWTLIEGTYAFALPGGIVLRDCFARLRDEILDQIRAALPLDAVVLSLHGAMQAEDCPDCEGDLLARTRAIVGDTCRIGVELDPHCHLTQAMLDNADLIVAYKEYPHTDFLACGALLLDGMAWMAQTGRRLQMAAADCAMIGRFHTQRAPMRDFVERMRSFESRDGIAAVSLIHGFPWGDVAETGTRLLVAAEDRARAQALAEALRADLVAWRDDTYERPVAIEDALARAASAPAPVVIADIADNPGGGAPGNSTILLQKLLQTQLRPACLGPLFDPSAIDRARSAGVGARCDLVLGGTLQVEGRILSLVEDASQDWAGTRMELGACCAIDVDGIIVVLAGLRDQAYGPDLFRMHGLALDRMQVIAVKSANHFSAGFAPLAGTVIYASGGGVLETDFTRIAYRKVARPKWPLDPLTPAAQRAAPVWFGRP